MLEGLLVTAATAASFVMTESSSVPSADLTLEDVVRAHADARAHVLEGANGVVVLCGTDTLEEVAFGLDALWDLDAPVVVTGALRTPDAPGADGPANFVAAAAVATDPRAAGRGCLVVLNDEIHAARYVSKRHPSNPAAFRSSPVGPVGAVTEGRVRFFARTPRPAAVTFDPGSHPAPVALLTFAIGDSANLLESVEAAGYRGLVIEGSGGGSVSARWAASLARLATRIPVVYASRTGTGPVLQATYGGGGGEVALNRLGIRPAGDLDGLKARVLLSLVIGASPDPLAEFELRAEIHY
jgi:L-asparaginase